jgi:hypothetical protein
MLVMCLWLAGHASFVYAQAAKHDAGDALSDLDDEPEQPQDGADTSTAAEAQPAQPTNESATAAPGTDLRAEPFVGFGVGTRSFRRPTAAGGQVMNDLPFPAAEVGMAMRAWPDRPLGLIFLLRYQSSIAFVVEEHPAFALNNRVNVRSDRAELSCGPTLRLGDSPKAARLSLPIGVMLRTFWPEVHNLATPRYIMAGPHLRAELRLMLTENLSMRLAPEFQWIMYFGSQLTDNGVGPHGVALGGEAGLRMALGPVFAIDITYRQSNAMANGTHGPTFLDVERFLTARLSGTM